MAMGGGGVQAFSPTIDGRIAADGVVVNASSFRTTIAPSNASAAADAYIYVEVVSGNAYVYVLIDGISVLGSWFEDDGTGNTATASTEYTVFTLGAEPDEIKVEVSGESTSSSSGGSASIVDTGSYTDGVFFTPVLTTGNYGARADTAATDTSDDGVSETASASFNVTFTFRKAGYEDYSITFSATASSTASKGLS